jgi:Carboxypeptidase regulatory-like domain
MPGATVLIVDGPNAGKSATTDAAGSYSLTGLQQSGFTANASASHYTSQSKSVTLTSDQTLSFQLTRSTPLPNFQGQHSGSYVTSGCTETSIGGFCAGLGMSVSRTLSLALSLQQNQTVVIGNLALGVTSNIAATLGTSTMLGPFQGLIQPSDHLAGSSTALSQGNPFCVVAPVDPGLPGGGGCAICAITATVSAWDTTIAGNTLSGSFRLVFNGGAGNAITGTATVSASLLQGDPPVNVDERGDPRESPTHFLDPRIFGAPSGTEALSLDLLHESKELARPAGLEPSPPGLEGPPSDDLRLG